MGFFGKIFTWWDGATVGTHIGLMGNTRVGEDALGNVYYEGGKTVSGAPRRQVVYDGSNDASRVPPEWHAWLHNQVDDVPDASLPPARRWEKEAKANATGTNAAYRPAGALESGGVRAQATGDYEAWTPDAP